jgi:adenosine deaminase
LLRFVNDFRIPLEICLTSNVQTRAASSMEAHPLRSFFDQGLVVTLNTDNRLMSGTTITDEYLAAHTALNFTWDEICSLVLMGFESAFLPHQQRTALVDTIRAELSGIARDVRPAAS